MSVEKDDNSQPLFRTDMDRDRKEKANTNKDGNGCSSISKCNEHWLFKTNKEATVEGTVNEGNDVTVESLEAAFQCFLTKMRQQKHQELEASSVDEIKSDFSVLATDGVRYLFKDDTINYERRIHPNNFTVNKPRQISQTMNTEAYIKLGTRPQLSRKVKSTTKYTAISELINSSDNGENNDDDDDDDDAFEVKNKRKSANDIESEKPFKRTKKMFDPQKNILTVPSDDEEKIIDTKTEKKQTIVDVEKQPGKIQTLFGSIKNSFNLFANTKKKTSENVSATENTATQLKKDEVECPMCNKLFSKDDINNHAFHCQGPVRQRVLRGSNKASDTGPADYKPWAEACNNIEISQNGNCSNKVENKESAEPIEIDVGQHNGYSTKENKTHAKSTAKHFKKGIDKYKRAGHLTEGNDDSDEIFDGYLPAVGRKKPTTTYTRTKTGINFFNESQDDETFKCHRCEQKFNEENYRKHTDQCLEESRLNV